MKKLQLNDNSLSPTQPSTMNRKMMVTLLCSMVLLAVVIENAEAGHNLRLARLAKVFLLARALKGKKIFLPLPLPLPIPLFKENIHHEPVPWVFL